MDLMESFSWSDAKFHELSIPLVTSAMYLGVCAVHRLYSGDRPTEMFFWKYVKWFLPYHNLFLALISLIMFVGCSWAVIEKSMVEQSLDWLLCEDVNVLDSGALEFWSYMYYLSKFYELLDTFLQLIRGRYPPHYLLHAYHHSGVLLMCWAWLEYRPSLRHIGLVFNVFVHIPMYYYFYLKSKSVDPWWKRYVTKLQIFQFVFSLVVFIFTVYLVEAQGRTCNSMSYLYKQLFFNVTLLLGFIGVLSGAKSKSKSTSSSSGANSKKQS